MNISIIIPTYNRRHTLGRAIESILRQSFQPSEIIVVDDRSNDGTGEWVKSNFPLIKLLDPFDGLANKGVSATRNAGIKAAMSSWIAFLDSDDEWLPQKLEKQVEAINQNPNIKFYHSDEIWIRNGVRVNQKKEHQKFGGNIFNQCLDKCRISPSTALIHKTIFESIGSFDESLKVCEDYDLWLRITAKFPVFYINDFLINKYGGHEDQLSHVKEGIEFHHIRVLEKSIVSDFSADQKESLIKMLIHKLNIYASGAKKRGRFDDFRRSMERINELSSVA